MERSKLTEQDRAWLDEFFGKVLDAYKAGKILRTDALAQLGHVVASVANGHVTAPSFAKLPD